MVDGFKLIVDDGKGANSSEFMDVEVMSKLSYGEKDGKYPVGLQIRVLDKATGVTVEVSLPIVPDSDAKWETAQRSVTSAHSLLSNLYDQFPKILESLLISYFIPSLEVDIPWDQDYASDE